MEENKDTVIEQEKSGRTFTQEEVNEIVKNRLSRAKGEKEDDKKRLDERETELTKREEALTKKEHRLMADELLREKNLPPESIGLVDLSNKETLKESIDLMSRLFGKKKSRYTPVAGGVSYDFSDSFKRPK